MNRRDAWVLREYDRELTITPDDREDMAYARERREEMLERKSEWEAECKKDSELTDPKEKIEVKEHGRDLRKHPLTDDELEEIEYQRWKRWDENYHWNRGY